MTPSPRVQLSLATSPPRTSLASASSHTPRLVATKCARPSLLTSHLNVVLIIFRENVT